MSEIIDQFATSADLNTVLSMTNNQQYRALDVCWNFLPANGEKAHTGLMDKNYLILKSIIFLPRRFHVGMFFCRNVWVSSVWLYLWGGINLPYLPELSAPGVLKHLSGATPPYKALAIKTFQLFVPLELKSHRRIMELFEKAYPEAQINQLTLFANRSNLGFSRNVTVTHGD